jgi:hypothetical protein
MNFFIRMNVSVYRQTHAREHDRGASDLGSKLCCGGGKQSSSASRQKYFCEVYLALIVQVTKSRNGAASSPDGLTCADLGMVSMGYQSTISRVNYSSYCIVEQYETHNIRRVMKFTPNPPAFWQPGEDACRIFSNLLAIQT